jgi:heptaprenyl diphosphate synthase
MPSRLQSSRDDLRIAYLTALAIVIHMAESVLPSPLPGIKPGLANIVTVAVFCRFGWRTAAWVALLRTLAGSLLLGTFLSPTFALSFAGAAGAVAALGLGQLLPGAGAVGLSILSALAHMAAQFTAAYFMFVPHPVLMTAALVFGVSNGIIAANMLKHLHSASVTEQPPA